MAFGLYLAWRYEWERLVTVIGGAFVVLIAGSLALGLVAPSIGRMTFEHPGAWSGLWTHKNTLGGIMALGVAVCVSAALVEPKRRKLFWLAWAMGAFALVLLSTSKTALVASMLGVAVIGACMLVRRGPLQALLVGAGVLGAVIVGVSIVLLAPDVIVAVLGRDLTLTGRTEIWEASARLRRSAALAWLRLLRVLAAGERARVLGARGGGVASGVGALELA